MGLWTLLESLLLLANALVILNEERFLAPKGGTSQTSQGGRQNHLTYRSNLCDTILESSPEPSQRHQYFFETGVWMSCTNR